MSRVLRVAAIQVTSIDGMPDRNLANATPFVERAAREGAQLALCPEFLATGYRFEESMWDAAEPAGGRTEVWLREVAATNRLTVGATFLEAEGEHFFNTFSLFGPTGTLLGRVRKQSLPFFEGWFFAPCPLPKVIETPFGKVGVGICNDNQTLAFLQHVANERPDLILMPHSAPTPHVRGLGRVFRHYYDAQLRGLASRYAGTLGIPVVLANKVSFEVTRTPIPLAPLVQLPMQFHGYSTVCDADGRVLGRLVDEEGALVGDVRLDPEGKRHVSPDAHGYWSFPPPLLATAMGRLLRTLDGLGQRSYRRNPRRAAAALRV